MYVYARVCVCVTDYMKDQCACMKSVKVRMTLIMVHQELTS